MLLDLGRLAPSKILAQRTVHGCTVRHRDITTLCSSVDGTAILAPGGPSLSQLAGKVGLERMDKTTHSRAAVRPVPEPQEESQVPRRSSLLRATFASLEYRDYVYLWLGQITHSGALWIDMVARPLLVLQLTGSPVHLGLVMAARTLPAVIFGVFAGVVADSFDRRTILLTTKVTVFGLSAVFAALILGGLDRPLARLWLHLPPRIHHGV